MRDGNFGRENWRSVMLPTDLYQTVTRKYGFFESFPAGIKLGINT